MRKKNKWPWKTAASLLSFPNPPKITVVTPSYQQGQFIEETILSVLNQDYPNLEFLVFDGGSTDDTVEVLTKYDAHIDYWVTAPDKGQSDAINKGFARATGDIVCWLNSDDYFYPDTLWRVAKFFSGGNYSQIYYGRGTWLLDKYNISIPNNTTKLARKHSIYLCDFLIQPSTFWGREVNDIVGPLSNSLHFGFDWEWFIRADQAGVKFTETNALFSCYRIHEDHKSGSAGDKRVQELASIYQRFLGEEVAEAYKRLHATNTNRRRRKILKRLPFGADLLARKWWKQSFSDIPFATFNGIRIM